MTSDDTLRSEILDAAMYLGMDVYCEYKDFKKSSSNRLKNIKERLTYLLIILEWRRIQQICEDLEIKMPEMKMDYDYLLDLRTKLTGADARRYR